MFLRRSLHRHLRRVQHIFDENAVARGGVVYHDVGDCADELAVLDDGAAAHAAYDAAGEGDEGGILDVDGEGLGAVGGVVDLREGDVVGGGVAGTDGGNDFGGTLLDLVFIGEREGLCSLGNRVQRAEDAAGMILRERAEGVMTQDAAQLAGLALLAACDTAEGDVGHGALSHRGQLTVYGGADAVTETAEDAAFGINKGHGTDAGDGVLDTDAEQAVRQTGV